MPDLSFSVNPGTGDLVYSDANGKPKFVKSADQAAQALSAIAATNLGSGATRQILSFAVSITPALTAGNTSAEQTFATFTGLATGDLILGVTPPAGPTAGLSGPTSARVSATNTLALTWGNHTAGNLTAPAGVYTVVVLR